MSNQPLDSNLLHPMSSIGDKDLDRSKNVSVASTATHPSAITGNNPNSADIFEQAKISFFSK